MQELEKILKEIDCRFENLLITDDECRKTALSKHDYEKAKYYRTGIVFTERAMDIVKDIIRKHMNDGWISVEKGLPPNANHKGALCPRCQVMTKYGVTEGWYNPDYESWYILCWFMGNDHLKHEIDFERGTFPKVVRCENSVNDKHGIVIAWRPLPEHAAWRRSETHDLR